MIKNLEYKLRSTCYNVNCGLSTAISFNFRNERVSNDFISSMCKQKLFKEALKAFEFLHRSTNFCIFISTYAQLLSACSSLRSLEQGRKVHRHILKSNCQPDIILQNYILNMYGKCGALNDARKVFDEMPQRNVVSWTSVIAGYSQNRQEIEAINLYLQMRQSGILPDQFTFGSVVRACSSLCSIRLGRQFHASVLKSEYGTHLIVQNALIAMYTKFGELTDALNVFSGIKTKDLISWSSIIAGFSRLGYELDALGCFKEMFSMGVHAPNEFTLGSVLSACGSLMEPEYGRQIHGISIKLGLVRDAFAGCSLSDMYARCGLLHSAKTTFFQIERPDLVSWNAIIAGLANHGDANETISFFSQMRYRAFTPDHITVLSLLGAFTNPLTLYQGKQVHSYIVKMGFDLDVPVCNTLLSMYAKCLDLTDAFKVFNEIRSNRDLVSWNAILTVCMQHNMTGEVFALFKLLLSSESKPNHITLASVLGGCGEIASLEMGDQVHCYIIKTGLKVDITVTNGLIDLYTKCGSLESAQNLFDCMHNPDIVSWSSLLVGYAQYGYGEEALELFRKMRNMGVKPNAVTFVGVLTACSHVRMVEEGLRLYNTMESEHGIVPTREHCSCVVDLFGRAGRIKEAEAFIAQMPYEPDIVVWKTLLAACKSHNNVEVGEWAAENILKIDPSSSTAHVLLCSIYASTGSWDNVARLRSSMKQKGINKVPGQSWIEIKDTMHVFVAEDCLHPERDKIYMMLEDLLSEMLDAGYVPFQNKVT